MDINQIKKLIKKVGGVLVMDGDEPSFVMLSYDNYNNLSGEEAVGHDQNEAVPVAVRNESRDYTEEFEHNLHAGLASNLVENFGEQEEQLEQQDEEKIQRLNEEIALLKNGIKQKELEAFGLESE